MPLKSYEECVEWLFSQFPSYQQLGATAYKPDLGNIQALLERIDHPEKELRFIHVAGSNGKGSTSSMLASILTESGERVGLFTSPHIESFTERIRVNGKMIEETFVVSFCNKIRQLDIAPSFFEITFAMALDYFNESHCSICVIETGLGGRLDATNCIFPIASIITNISLEHTQLLGDTEEQIAFEKAGIIKSETPVFVGRAADHVKAVFSRVAQQKVADITYCGEYVLDHSFTVPLNGAHQQENFNTVLHVINWLNTVSFTINENTISNGLKRLYLNTGFFGRLQLYSNNPRIILDVSHNAEGIAETLKFVRTEFSGELYIIFGTSSDKEIEKILPLFQSTDHLIFTPFSNPRSRSCAEWEEISTGLQKEPLVFSCIDEALTYCKSMAKVEDTILVTGSFFLLTDFFHFFQRISLPE
jgi:dihydrofolate synthase/folylpolyglutamate synthase